jgi:hypothetical protein
MNRLPSINMALRVTGDTSALPAMVESVRRSGKDIESAFNQSFESIGRLAQRALSMPRNAAGSLDLGIDEYQAAARAAQAHAIALREIATAARLAAVNNGDTTEATRLYVQAADAAARAAEGQAREAQSTASAYDKLQAELNQAVSATQEVVRSSGQAVAANGRVAQSTGQVRLAMLGATQQAQDVAISLYSGQRASTVFAQQLPQLAFALSALEGSTNKTADRIGRFATFMSGPWGLAIGLGIGALFELGGALLKTGQDADTAADKFKGAAEEARALIGAVNALALNEKRMDLNKLTEERLGLETLTAKLPYARDPNARMWERNYGLGGAKRRLAEIAWQEAELRNLIGIAEEGNRRAEAEAARPPRSRRTGSASTATGRASGSTAKAADDAAEATRRLAEFGQDAARQVAGIARGFAEVTPALGQSERIMEQIAELSAEITERKPTGWQDMLATLEAMKPLAADIVNGPFKAMVSTAQEQAKIDALLIEGREYEAEVMRRTLQLQRDGQAPTAEQLKAVREIVAQEQVRARLIERQGAMRQIELDYLQATQNNLRQTIATMLSGKGIGSIGGLIQRQLDAVTQELADSISENLFGDFFRDERDRALGKLTKANEAAAGATSRTTEALGRFTSAIEGATAAVNDNAPGATPANAPAPNVQAMQSVYKEAVVTGSRQIGRAIKPELKGIGADIAANVKTALQGAVYGQAASGIGKSLGIKQSKTGSQIGGAIGMAVGGPVGAMIGGFLGGTIGGMFKSTPKGRVTVTESTAGYRGAGRYRDQLLDAGSGIQGGIESIADQLGGSVGSYSVSLKRKGKKYYVNGQKFRDEQDAAEAAILAAIQNGAVKGIKAGAQRLLAAGTDLDRQLSKAVKFQNVFDELDNLKDPVGFAVRSLNREFEGLIRIFNEAGATAEEMAQLEELYGIKRAAAVEEANDRIAASLKSLYDELTVGNEALPLRMRQAMAMERYTGLEARVKAGDTSAYDDFAEATQTLMAVSRELFGSQQGYFDLLSRTTGVTTSAITSQSALASSASSIANPFTGGAAGTGQVIGAIDALGAKIVDGVIAGLGYRADATNDNLGVLIMQGIAAARVADAKGLTSTGTW